MTKNNDDNSLKQAGCPLENLEELSPSQLQSLKTLWITTIEDFVSATATQEGKEGLCGLLGLEMSGLNNLMSNARDVLGEDRYNELRVPSPGGPTGALLDNGLKGPPHDSPSGSDEDL